MAINVKEVFLQHLQESIQLNEGLGNLGVIPSQYKPMLVSMFKKFHINTAGITPDSKVIVDERVRPEDLYKTMKKYDKSKIAGWHTIGAVLVWGDAKAALIIPAPNGNGEWNAKTKSNVALTADVSGSEFAWHNDIASANKVLGRKTLNIEDTISAVSEGSSYLNFAVFFKDESLKPKSDERFLNSISNDPYASGLHPRDTESRFMKDAKSRAEEMRTPQFSPSMDGTILSKVLKVGAVIRDEKGDMWKCENSSIELKANTIKLGIFVARNTSERKTLFIDLSHKQLKFE